MDQNISTRYERAQTILKGMMPGRTVLNDAVFSHWIEDSTCFWYRRETQTGKEFRLVDAKAGINELAFDHQVLANALAEATGQNVNYRNLPIEGKDAGITLSPKIFTFTAFSKKWRFDDSGTLAQQSIELPEETEDVDDPVFAGDAVNAIRTSKQPLHSPDGRQAIFTRNHNLWIRNTTTGEENELTIDGTKEYRYAVDLFEAECVPQAIWSPDSRYVFTTCLDTQNVRSTSFPAYVPIDGGTHQMVSSSKFAFAGDDNIECYRLVLIDIEKRTVRAINYPPLPFITYGDPPIGFFSANLGWWSSDSQRAFFVDVARGAKAVRVMALDVDTGETHSIIEETSETFVKLKHSIYDKPMFRLLPDTDELIWFSERSGWGHLYLYDLKTGELKNSITGSESKNKEGRPSTNKGEWLVRDILHYSADQRELLIQTAARDININPYYRDICKINIDTGEITTLASGNADYSVYTPSTLILMEFEPLGVDRFHINGVSPDGKYIVATHSRVDTVPVSILIDRDGREILELETADVSALPDYWQWPEPVKLKSADSTTDIYGVVFHPIGYSPDKHYPVLEYCSAGRMISTLPQGSFFNTPQGGIDYLLMAALAALGFVVIQIEGRGLPLRNKAFQDHHYGDFAYASDYQDRMSGIRQLAKLYPHMNLEHIGITGIEGAPNTAYGPIKHSEFYKVGVVHHVYDPRFTPALLGEMYDGTEDPRRISNMTFPEDFADSFNGKLLLICRMLSFSTPAGPFRLAEALQKANKNFDMLCLPSSPYPFSTYNLRCEWDYLVKHLQGVEPPKDFPLTTGRDLLTAYFESKS